MKWKPQPSFWKLLWKVISLSKSCTVDFNYMKFLIPWTTIRTLPLTLEMFRSELFPPLLAIMCSGKYISRLTLTMRPALIFGFEVSLNLLSFSFLCSSKGLHIPSRPRKWLNFKKGSSPIVLAKFPCNNNRLWKVVSIDGRLLLYHCRIGTLTISTTLNMLF